MLRRPDGARLARPPKELKAFAKVRLDPGESTVVELVLDDRAFAYWDPGQADWETISARALAMFGGHRPSAADPGGRSTPVATRC